MTAPTSFPLGRRIYSSGFALYGVKPYHEWRDFLVAVTHAIGMQPVSEAKAWTYPVDGKGGTGQTIVQPITESFLALDTWPDHRGAYLFIVSCKSFEPAALTAVLAQFDLALVGESGRHSLALP